MARWSTTAPACTCGATARTSSGCAARSRPALGARAGRRSRSSTSRAPAPTGTTAPTTPRSTRCCSPGRCPGRPVHVRWRRADELSLVAVRLGDGGRRRRLPVRRGPDGVLGVRRLEPGPHLAAGLRRLARAAGRRAPRAAAQPLPDPVDPPPERGAGSTRNAVPGYPVPVRRIRGHRRQDVALRTSSLRTLGAYGNVFAIESMVDEVADCAGADPLDFRLAHLDDDRGRAVLQAVADHVGWAVPAARRRRRLGLGYARYKAKGAYCAVVAEVEAVSDVRVRRLTLAVDVGRVVNPDGVRNQIEGGAVQSTSVDAEGAGDLRPHPGHQRRLGDLPDPAVQRDARRSRCCCSTGPSCRRSASGEASQGPTAAAIGNARGRRGRRPRPRPAPHPRDGRRRHGGLTHAEPKQYRARRPT